MICSRRFRCLGPRNTTTACRLRLGSRPVPRFCLHPRVQRPNGADSVPCEKKQQMMSMFTGRGGNSPTHEPFQRRFRQVDVNVWNQIVYEVVSIRFERSTWTQRDGKDPSPSSRLVLQTDHP